MDRQTDINYTISAHLDCFPREESDGAVGGENNVAVTGGNYERSSQGRPRREKVEIRQIWLPARQTPSQGEKIDDFDYLIDKRVINYLPHFLKLRTFS